MRNFPVLAGRGWSDAFAANAATGAVFAGAEFRDVWWDSVRLEAGPFPANNLSFPLRNSTTSRYGLDSMLTEKFDPSFVSRTIRVTPATGWATRIRVSDASPTSI